MRIGGGRRVVVEHRAFRSCCSALDVLPGQACGGEQHHPGPVAGLDDQPTIDEGEPLVLAGCSWSEPAPMYAATRSSPGQGGTTGTSRSRPHLASLPVQLSCSQLRRDMGPAEGPAATKCEVEAETKLVCPFGSEAEVGQEAPSRIR